MVKITIGPDASAKVGKLRDRAARERATAQSLAAALSESQRQPGDRAEVMRYRALHAEAHAAARAAESIVARIDSYARQHGLLWSPPASAAAPAKPARASKRANGGDPAARLADVRASILALQQRREAVLSTRVTKAEALRRVTEFANQVQPGEPDIAAFFDPKQAGVPLLDGGSVVGTLIYEHRSMLGKSAAIVGWAAKDLVRDRLSAKVEADYAAGEAGLSEAARRRALDEVGRELLGLEIEEEALIEALDASGVSVPRRHDCDVRAILTLGPDAPVEGN